MADTGMITPDSAMDLLALVLHWMGLNPLCLFALFSFLFFSTDIPSAEGKQTWEPASEWTRQH